MKHKEFRDPVHGYIPVPEDYCKKFIDTDIFQRLRRIEQTSMRVLYPSAHHDRFSHSLGVYHLGSLAFHHLRKNSKGLLKDEITPDEWNVYKETFRVACLLHDCAHAPFSHTFEHFYEEGGADLAGQLKERLAEKDPTFENDWKAISPKPHEIASAIVLLERYSCGTPLLNSALAARMITGCIHSGERTAKQCVENGLIGLLNGSAIDVDKLDYTLRDTWASGVHNVTIDIARLLSALKFVKTPISGFEGKYEVAFGKSALSVVKNVVQGRNYLFEWVHCHHTVKYDSHILCEAVKQLPKHMPGTDEDEFFKSVFSLERFFTPCEMGGQSFFMPTDGDFISLLKQYRNEIQEAKEWLSRRYTKRALWKTFAEHRLLFNEITHKETRKKCQVALGTVGVEALNQEFGPAVKFVHIDATPNLASLETDDVKIEIGPGRMLSYSEIFPDDHEHDPGKFGFVFCSDQDTQNFGDYTKFLIGKLQRHF